MRSHARRLNRPARAYHFCRTRISFCDSATRARTSQVPGAFSRRLQFPTLTCCNTATFVYHTKSSDQCTDLPPDRRFPVTVTIRADTRPGKPANRCIRQHLRSTHADIECIRPGHAFYADTRITFNDNIFRTQNPSRTLHSTIDLSH